MIGNRAFATRTGAGTLRFERLLPGPIERVWDHLTRRDLLATWLAPIDLPATPGATFVHDWDEDGSGRLEGRIRIYQPPSVLEVDWTENSAPAGPLRDTIVRFELTALGERVRLVLTHRAGDPRFFSTLGAGWHAHLDALIARISDAAPVDPGERYALLAPQYAALTPPV